MLLKSVGCMYGLFPSSSQREFPRPGEWFSWLGPVLDHLCPWVSNNFLSFFLRFYLFLERGEGREKEEEWNNVLLPLAHPLLETWPATQACALTGNQTKPLWFAGLRSIHWATSARDGSIFLKSRLHKLIMTFFPILWPFLHDNLKNYDNKVRVCSGTSGWLPYKPAHLWAWRLNLSLHLC